MIFVLRLSHRIARDIRLTSHLCLCARAFLCDKLYYSGQRDVSLEESIREVNKKFGGDFEVYYLKDPKAFVDSFEGVVVHLTMYGERFLDKLSKIRGKDLLIIVGGPKVEPWVYKSATFNLSVTSQPISEVGALSVFLHELHNKKEIGTTFKDARLKVIASKSGKVVQKR